MAKPQVVNRLTASNAPPTSIKYPRMIAMALSPLGRIGKAGEIADAVLFLASDESSFVMDEALVVDDGGAAG